MLLLHGFGDTPQTLAHLARYLHERGFDVRAPLLPGHGRSIAAMDVSNHTEWLDSARAELFAMRARYRRVAVGGLSMGGAIAAILAAEVRDLEGLMLIAPYFVMPWRIKLLSAAAPLWSELFGPIEASSVHSILDPAEREANLAYGVVTGRSIRELSLLLRDARNVLSRITAPTLLIQSEKDNRIAADVSRRMFDELRMDRKRFVLTREGGHIITVDYGRARVFEEVRAWLETGPGTSPQPGRPE
ncbi:MAG: alpha/beta fold hydrolase [Gemmatimonadaceae bacterium]